MEDKHTVGIGRSVVGSWQVQIDGDSPPAAREPAAEVADDSFTVDVLH